MNIVYAVRRSFPGPGGIASAMRAVARVVAIEHHLRVWAARIDGAPLTRLNATLAPQTFSPFWMDGTEVRPIPRTVSTQLASGPMALMTVPVVRRVGYDVLRRATAPGYVRAVGRSLARAFGRADLVHCWGGEHTNWAAGDAAARLRAPLVVTPFAHPGEWGDDPLNAAFYRRADAVLALVPSEADVYRALGVDDARIHVVGVPVTTLPADGPDVRAVHGIGSDPLVLFLGVKEPYKGYRILLRAAERVWRRHPRARFAFIGPRTEASRSDFARVEDERIIEIPHVDDAEVASWHRAATVFCLPSTSEIMPVSILEAWNAGAPVVAARWWCADDLITEGADGHLTQAEPEAIAHALIGLLDDPDAARAMGAAGRARVHAEFTAEAVAARHLAVYRALG